MNSHQSDLVRAVQAGEVNRVAILCLSGMGNLLLFIPALRRLRKILPNAEITLYTIRAANYELMKNNPYCETIYLKQRRYNSFFDNISVLWKCFRERSKKYDLSFSVFPTNRPQYNIVLKLFGAKYQIGFQYPYKDIFNLGFFNSSRITADPILHDLEQNLRLLDLLGDEKEETDSRLEFWSTQSDADQARQFLATILQGKSEPIVAYHPACFPDMTYKRWPPEYYAKLIDLLETRYHPAAQLLFGTKSDRSLLESIASQATAATIIVDNQSLGVVGEILRRSNLLVSNDSGLMHIGAAVETKVLGLFSSTMDSRTAPRGEDVYVLRGPYQPGPCRGYPFSADHPDCCGGKECMATITPKMVLGKIQEANLL